MGEVTSGTRSTLIGAGIAVAAVAAVVVLIVVLSGGSESHELTATFESATNLVAGARVTAGGVPVGRVEKISLKDGLASVRMSIDDDVWPLHQGTKAEIRWGGTVSYSDRYVELLPGPRSEPALAAGATLPTADTVTPVEFDQAFDVFDEPARRALGSLTDNSAATFGGRATELHDGLTVTPPALGAVSDVLHELGENPQALQTLVSTGASTAQALETQQAHLTDLVGGAATTFTTIADHAESTRQTLAQLPPALVSATTMLRRLDPALSNLGTVVDRIRPGARQLDSLARPLGSAVSTLGTVAPELNETLVDLQHGAPGVTSLLNHARPLLGSARPALAKLDPMLSCIRPYAPELAGFFSTWLSMGSFYDGVGHYGRALVQVFPADNLSTESPAQEIAGSPGQLYAIVRPPGLGAAQPWLQPQCGAGASALDPSDDPEAGG